LIHFTNYSLGANYCTKTFLKGGGSIFVYRNLIYTTINIEEYNIENDIVHDRDQIFVLNLRIIFHFAFVH